jgi:CDP-diacylglycerol--glycerol-3-phosphate 3-phosphatidyltransferase
VAVTVSMTAANWITVARLGLVPVFVVALIECLQSGAPFYRWLSLGVLAAAGLGDIIDGYVARRFHQETSLGALLDPLADKLLLVLALVMLSLHDGAQVDRVPLWLTATVLCRDVMLLMLVFVVGLRRGYGTPRPRTTGRVAAILQWLCVFGALLHIGPAWLMVLASAATGCTAVAGALYLRDGLNMLKER